MVLDGEYDYTFKKLISAQCVKHRYSHYFCPDIDEVSSSRVGDRSLSVFVSFHPSVRPCVRPRPRSARTASVEISERPANAPKAGEHGLRGLLIFNGSQR